VKDTVILDSLIFYETHSLLLVEKPLSEPMRFSYGVVPTITQIVDFFVFARPGIYVL
jgi:hypothetical protein